MEKAKTQFQKANEAFPERVRIDKKAHKKLKELKKDFGGWSLARINSYIIGKFKK